MRPLTLIRCGSLSRRSALLETLSLPRGTQLLDSDLWLKTLPSDRESRASAGEDRALLFVLSVDEFGPDEGFVRLLRGLRARPGCLAGCIAGVLVIGETELDTKALARQLIFTADLAGCGFPERPLVEATGSMKNLLILQNREGLPSPQAALEFAAEGLIQRLLSHQDPRFDRPRLLVLHASDRATSNTLTLGDLVTSRLDPRFRIRTLSLRNGAIEDCRGCSYKVCSHFASKGSCFYGGSIAQEVLPAVLESDALLLLLPNYNDAVGANVMAFINRLTSLHVSNTLTGKRLYAVVVSGYSGGDLVAQQALGALCLNKSFLLPPRFCLLQTANMPGDVRKIPDVEDQAEAFAARLGEQMLLK